MERLTKCDEYGNAKIIGVDDMKIEYDVGADDYDKITDVIDKLVEYEDLEEQGKLLRLPCAVGDTVYEVSDGDIRKHKVFCIYLDEDNVPKLDLGWHCTILDNFGKTVFLTREAAETALKNWRRRKDRED